MKRFAVAFLFLCAAAAPLSSSAAQLPAPVFNPPAGNYSGPQSVSITDPGAKIYYTTDGSTPTTSSTAYSSPIAISASTTLQAVAITDGHGSSSVATATYTITAAPVGVTAATPTASPAPGTYGGPLTVTLNCSTANSTIYYTADGSTPTTSSAVYSSGISVTSSATISALCAAAGDTNSAVMTAAYFINVPGNNSPRTWYVRPDGGTRYSAYQPAGQCDGLADAPYPGSGVNQHCAFGDYRWLYDPYAYNHMEWAISGGDTVILRGGPWRVGWDTRDGIGETWCVGGSGNSGCTNPTIPSGTPTQHTRILGENYGSCNKSNMTQIFGGHGVGVTLNLTGAQYVDVQCVELTRHSQCIQHGSPALPSLCHNHPPLDDFSSDGIITDTGTHDVLLQDMWIHGFTDRGVLGPIGGTVTAERVDISTNGMAGWDFDDGSGSNNGNGTASVNGVWNFWDSIIEFSGCNQEYPAVDSIPVASCYSQNTGGYGDGLGTPPGGGFSVNVRNSISRYNTQDGMDFGHVDTGAFTLYVANSQFYGSNGQQLKWAANYITQTVVNNEIVGNCLRMSQPLPGAPSSYNTNLTDFCRAGSTLSWDYRNGDSLTFAFNSIAGYGPTAYVISCWDASCSNTTANISNNILLGYDNSSTYNMGGQTGGPGSYYCQDMNGKPTGCSNMGTTTRANNIYYGLRVTNFACPTGFSGETCQDPQFVSEPTGNGGSFSEAELDNFNFNLSSNSPAIQSGVALPGLTLDLSGAVRPNPPSIGALEFSGVANAVTVTAPVFSLAGGTYSSAQTLSITDATSGATIYYTLDGSLPTSSSSVYSSPIVISSNTTLRAMAVASGSANSAVVSATFNIVALSSISVSPSTVSLLVGATSPVAASCTYSDGSTSDCTAAATWTSSNGSVATVAGGGVTAIGAGTANVSATIGSITSNSTSITVTVSPSPGQAALSVDQPQITFTSFVTVGLHSRPVTVTVTNPTQSVANGIAVNVPSGFLTGSDQCSGTSLGAGASCAFSIVFSPEFIGVNSGTVTITGVNVLPAIVAVSGTGTSGFHGNH